MAYKWRILLQPYHVTISLLQATRLYFVSNFLATFSPGGLGGDAYRVIALSGLNKSKIITYTVIIERFIGLVVLGTFALITLPFSISYFNISYRSIIWLIILILFLLVLFILFIIFPKYAGGSGEKLRLVYGNNFILKIRSYFESIVINKNHYKTISLFTLLCSMEVGLLIFMNYLAAISIGVYIKLGYFFCTLPVLYLLIRLPITVQGIGIQEGLWAYIFSLAGYSASDGLAMSFLLRISEIIAIFIPAGIFFLTGSIRIPKSKNI